MSRKLFSSLGRWVRRNGRAVVAALSRSPHVADRELARELDRALTEYYGEDY